MSQKILAIAFPSEQYALLQQKAIAQQKEACQLGLEIIRNWLSQQTEIEENVASESKDEQALEAAYRQYYAHAEEDLRLVRNMRGTQMCAFERCHRQLFVENRINCSLTKTNQHYNGGSYYVKRTTD